MVNKIIVCCECEGIPNRAKFGFSILFKDDEVPEIVIGQSKIIKYSEKFPFDSIGARRLRAIAKSSDKFAHYLEVNADGEVKKQHDLLKGRRIQ